jgi:hypothetical protein
MNSGRSLQEGVAHSQARKHLAAGATSTRQEIAATLPRTDKKPLISTHPDEDRENTTWRVSTQHTRQRHRRVPVRGGSTNGSTRLDGLPGFQLVEGENVGREGEYSSKPGGLSGGPTAGAAQRHVYG